MLAEFFLSPAWNTSAIAWVGMLLIVVHAVYKSWLALQFTYFYRDFYDLMQRAAGGHDQQLDCGSGAGSGDSGDSPTPSTLAEVYAQLLIFAYLAIPAAIIHPIASWFQSRYALAWRLALIQSYLSRWEASGVFIEGASQRIQEDTQRFAEGLEVAFATLLDVAFTLSIFTPRLADMGRDIPPPWSAHGGSDDHWLVWATVLLATFGTLVSLCIARRLVDLEVQNQRVEAGFRKDLVIWEDCVAPVNPSTHPPRDAPSTANCAGTWIPDLRSNYRLLYKHFAYFNAWVAAFEQATTILPYLVGAPRLFDATAPISLGKVVEFSRIFDRVFGALTVPMHDWARFNEFRSVLRRLHEFEQTVPRKTREQRTVTAEMAMAPFDADSIVVVEDCPERQ